MAGPLRDVRVLELAGIGPGPFCGMMLADMGAEVLRIDRANSVPPAFSDGPRGDILGRGRRSIGVDLKHPEGVETVLRLVAAADVIYEGFRPGVTERLGLGPDVCLARNPRIIYGRMTGWGQEGPLAPAAGHDINYIALSGALHAIGRKGEKPVPPLNLVGDFGGGGLLLAYGIVCALIERISSGKGQVVDAAIVDGAAALMAMFYGALQSGWWTDERGVNILDSGSHFYDTYETRDGKHVAIGSIEPQFYALLLKHTGLAGEDLPSQFDRQGWPEMRTKLAAIFKTKTRDEWCTIMEGTDVCFAPVLTLREAPRSAHAVARKAFREVAGVIQPAPAPRFSRTAPQLDRPTAHPGEHTDEALRDWGFDAEEIARLRTGKAIA
jgi:alpha-methylacyl-CoA racemase